MKLNWIINYYLPQMLKRGIADMHASFVTATASPVELIKQTIEHMNLPETERYNAFNVSVICSFFVKVQSHRRER